MTVLSFVAEVQHFSGSKRVTIPKVVCEAGGIEKGDFIQVHFSVVPKPDEEVVEEPKGGKGGGHV